MHSSTEHAVRKNLYSASVLSAILYGICSTSMAFINKAVVSSYEFNFPFFIMSCQMAASVLVLEICRICGYVQLLPYSTASDLSYLWPSFFYAAHSITSLYALSGMSIPMYAAVKRCAPIVMLILSVILLKKSFPPLKMIVAIVFITVGCILAGLGDLQFDIMAYGYGAISVVVQGLYLTLIQKCADKSSALQILLITSYNTLPMFSVLSIISDMRGIVSYGRFSDIGFILSFTIQVFMGVLLNFSLFLCTMKNSALTTSLVGVMKSVLQTVVGSVTFGGIAFNLLNIFGIALNTIGGVLYLLLKYQTQLKTVEQSSA